MSDVTQILSAIEHGDPSASEELLPLVYDELRKLAGAKLANEKPGQTLQATALVHEAYVRIVDPRTSPFNSRRHFFAAAAEAMRRILVDRARQKLAAKRGGAIQHHDIADHEPTAAVPEEVVAVHDALDALASDDALAAELVNLHYFAGFSMEESAGILGLSRATAYRKWTYARAWLRSTLRDDRH